MDNVKKLLLKTVLLAAGMVFVFTCIFRVRRAEGNAMSPFVRDGDLCIFLKLSEPTLGEVVLYRDSEGREHVGRITAIGGQTVDFPEAGGYTVDGYEPVEEIPYETHPSPESTLAVPLMLGEDEVFLMHDFRSLTNDSRENGAINRGSIEGKLLFLLRRRGF